MACIQMYPQDVWAAKYSLLQSALLNQNLQPAKETFIRIKMDLTFTLSTMTTAKI